MDSFLTQIPFRDLGLAGLVTLTVVLILLGRLVPRSVAEEWKGQAAYWRQAHQESEQNRAESIKQLSSNTEALRTLAENKDVSVALLEAIQGGQRS